MVTSFPFPYKLSHVTDPALGLSTHKKNEEYKVAGTSQKHQEEHPVYCTQANDSAARHMQLCSLEGHL